jgi:hypothetical protein
MDASISIWTARAPPSLGRNSDHGSADHQQGIATLHEVPAWLGAEQSDRAGDEGQVIRQHVFPEQCFRDAGSQEGGHLDQ